VQDELKRVEATDARSIVVDLSDLTFMDSSGMRVLLSAHARSRADANRLTLLRGLAAVRRALELTGVLITGPSPTKHPQADLCPDARTRRRSTDKSNRLEKPSSLLAGGPVPGDRR
jgi:STAS domain